MRATDMRIRTFLSLIGMIGAALDVAAQQPVKTNLVIDAGTRYQTFDGFGVNINATWWLDGDYRDAGITEPAIDILIDSLGAAVFRVVIEEMDWETINDDKDPENFNWNYYNEIFSNARFRGVWNTLHYLNQRGITDMLIISFMGGPPASAPLTEPDPVKSWMGNTNFSINESFEDEFVESIAALLYYARNTEKIKFTRVSPMNETDIISSTKGNEHPNGIVEGPDMPDANQFVRVIRKLAEKLDRIGMGDIRFVTPDAAGDKLFNACFDEIIKDPYLMGKIASWGVHQYGKDAENYLVKIRNNQNYVKNYWVTESAGIKNILGQLDDSGAAYIFWDGFDCVYQHARRNGYGSEPPNDWVFWEGDPGRPLLAYNRSDQSWTPRKQFYEFSQLFKFVRPGAVRVGASINNSEISVSAYRNPDGQLVIFGRNNGPGSVAIDGTVKGIPAIRRLKLYITNTGANLQRTEDVFVTENIWQTMIPPETVFTLTGAPADKQIEVSGDRPEPEGWYAGDMHVHRNCGDVTPVWSEDSLAAMMETNNLSVISLLADMGNGEVKDSRTDLGKVTGLDAPQSDSQRILHYDAEWHFDPEGVTFEHKAPGGHLVLLGLKEAHTIWEESPYRILEWGEKQNAVMGFCHLQYLNDTIQDQLNCCIPIDFPVETALGTIDFLSEDVWLNDASVNAYYKILNCGFRPGWAAGTDFPCNNRAPLGSLLTYVQVKDGPLTYTKWIEGIRNGRTVVTTNGHTEFLDFRINDSASPGDEIVLGSNGGRVNIKVTWSSLLNQEGSIEIVCNGHVVLKQDAWASPGKPVMLNADLQVNESSWICARRMNSNGHQSHTAPVYVNVGNKPVRASEKDAEYFTAWIDNILENIEDGAPWSVYFKTDIDEVRARYRKASGIYKKIAEEARSCRRQPESTPILLLATDTDFGTYTGEILHAEGFNSFNIKSVLDGTVELPVLRNFDVVILTEHEIGTLNCEMLKKYVSEGGILIAFRPDAGLYDLFGISGTEAQTMNGYIAMDTITSPGMGLRDQIIQFHGISEQYKLKTAAKLASLYEGDGKPTNYPALVSNKYGSGTAYAFSYNLSETVVLTRQGNPLSAGREMDGIHGIRAMDLFTGGWVDTSKNIFNQADVHMNLMSHCIVTSSSAVKPLPRFWYFPDNLRCLVTLTNDGEYRAEGDFEAQFSDMDSLQAKMTLYILKTDLVTKEWAEKWIAKGFEISGHPDDTREAGDPLWSNMYNALESKKREIAGLYGIDMKTVANHWFVWCGKDSAGSPEFAAQAMIEADQGLGMDINYAHYDNGSSEGHFLGTPGYSQGNYNGSGMVMRFTNSRGKVLNIYQHLNNVYDQQYMELKDPVGFFECFKGLMDRSLDHEIYSLISIKSHNDEYGFSEPPLRKMIAYAADHGIPVWSAANLFDFIKAKDEARFTDIRWNGKKLSFILNSSLECQGSLTFMVPAGFSNSRIHHLTIDRKAYRYEERMLKGIKYAFVTVKPGYNYNVEVEYIK